MSEIRPLRAYAEVVLGRQRSPAHDQGDHMVPYLRAANVKDGFLDLSDVKEMNFSPNEQRRYALRPGDVLVTEGSGSLSSVGATSVWSGELPGTVCFQNTLLRLRPRSSVSGRFLAWWCRYAFDDGLLAGIATGANIYHLAAERLRSLPVTYVQPEAQRAIADYLDAETARIDALIAKKRQLARLLGQRFRDRVRHLMGELFDQHGSLPLKRLVQCLDGQRIPVSSTERAQRTGPYPYYGASGVVDTIDDYLFDEELVLLGEDGAQLLDPEYHVAFVVRGKCWVNNHAHVLRPRLADAEFLALHLATLDRAPFLSGSTRPKLTQDDMGRIPVPRCDLTVQRQTAMRLSQEEAQIGELTDRLDRQVGLLREHRQALITAAVSGELQVPGVAA